MKRYKGNKYSQQHFEEYKMRYKVSFEILHILPNGEKTSYEDSIDIYTTAESERQLIEFIEDNKKQKVLQYSIVNSTTKEQDELTAQLIDEILKEPEHEEH